MLKENHTHALLPTCSWGVKHLCAPPPLVVCSSLHEPENILIHIDPNAPMSEHAHTHTLVVRSRSSNVSLWMSSRSRRSSARSPSLCTSTCTMGHAHSHSCVREAQEPRSAHAILGFGGAIKLRRCAALCSGEMANGMQLWISAEWGCVCCMGQASPCLN